MKEFASKFEKDLSMVSCFSSSTVPKNVWYVDSGASRHMASARDLFMSLTEQVSVVQLELGDDAKYLVVGIGTIPFQLQSGNSLQFDDILFVPGLIKRLFQFQPWKIRVMQYSLRTSKPS